MTTAITPVTPDVPIDVMPQGSAVSSAQQITIPVGEAVGAITTVAVSEVPATSQVPSTIAFSLIPSIPGTFHKLTESAGSGDFHHSTGEYLSSESTHNYPAFWSEDASQSGYGSWGIDPSLRSSCHSHCHSGHDVTLEKSSSQYPCNVGEFTVTAACTNGSVYL